MTKAHDQKITHHSQCPETCDICGASDKLELDHNHATGRIRGWLCRSCNFRLGTAKDDPALLRASAAYLEDPPRDGDYYTVSRQRQDQWRRDNLERSRAANTARVRKWRQKNREHVKAYRKARKEAGLSY